MDNFYTSVLRKSPNFTSPTRCNDMALLEPVMRRKVEAILRDAAGHNVPLRVYETYRSPARQQQLFRQGATKLRTVGTHGYGLAVDFVRVVKGQPSWEGDFSILLKLCRAHSLISGIDWGHPGKPNSFVDSGHVQRITVARQNSLFNGEWYPDESYDPLPDG